MKRALALCLAWLTLMAALPAALAEEEDWSLVESVLLDDEGNEIPDEPSDTVLTPRDDLIDRIIALGQELFIRADGKAQRAHYAGDIYVCKNFTVYLFRQNRDDFRMAEYPDTPLVIPNNLPAKQCKPYYYGFLWENIPASAGNPFYAAAQFIYDTDLSADENMALALEFMKQVRKGDYFQMSADYAYGVGAHSAIMIADYDPARETVRWMDSNMRGGKRNGIRYGLVQFDEEAGIDWWAKAFCHKKRGATLYRLRDDIIYAEGREP